jgi:hypothetical protein
MAGVVYLNEEYNINAGTSLFKLKPNVKNENHEDFDNWHNLKNEFYRGNTIDLELYKSYLKQNHDMFYETARFNNIYNRMICYNFDEYHRANSFYGEEPRLTLVFFLNNFTANNAPLERLRRFSRL